MLSHVQLLQPHELYSPQSSSVYGISQARILKWVPFPSPIHPVHKCKLGKPLAESVSCSHTHEGSPHKHALSRETPDRHCHRQNHSSTVATIHIQTPSFFSLLGDSPQLWSHEATGWGVSGVCVGDELLKPPSCGQLPRHRMEGLWAACLMKKLRGRQARNPEGSRERSGRELSRCGSGCVCVPCLSPLVGTPNSIAHTGTRESEAKAEGQRSVLGSILVVIIRGNVRQPPRGRCWTDRHAGEERAQTDRYSAEAVLGQTGGAGDKQTAAV